MPGTEVNRDEEIRQLAYRLWQEAGCPNGCDVQHWLRAEAIWAEIHPGENRPTSAKPSKARKPRQARTVKREL
jgi:hypothetical protein